MHHQARQTRNFMKNDSSRLQPPIAWPITSPATRLNRSYLDHMNDPFLLYDNPLITRYAAREMAERWGPQRKHRTWRQLWLALAEAQFELGLMNETGKKKRIS